MEENQKKIIDRMQFLGLIGPVILLLTLFCTLLKGTPKSGYLFCSTLVGLPLCWKWSWKGLFASLGLLFALFFSFYSFFPPEMRLWQLGASASLGLGLFITFIGFEELKEAIRQINLESQSRLDNLIDLDEKFNKSLETWKYDEAELQNEIEKKSQMLKREQEELAALEKMSLTLRAELEGVQGENLNLLDELEKKAQSISRLEADNLKISEDNREVELKLSQSTSDREHHALHEFELLESKMRIKEEKIAELTEKLNERLRQQSDLGEQVERKDEAFKNMQEALRQKASSIQELEEKILLRDQSLNKQKEEVSELLQAVNQKEHEILTVKSGLNERDYQIQKLNQSLRDMQQELTQSRSRLEEKKLEYNSLEVKLNQEVSRWENAYKTNEIQLKNYSDELSLLRGKLEKSHLNHTAVLQDKKQLQEELEAQDAIQKALLEEKQDLLCQFEQKEADHLKAQDEEERLREKQFDELKKLNDARFALYQASLDKERLKNQTPQVEKQEPSAPQKEATPRAAKHWLKQLEQLIKGENTKKVDFSLLPKDLSSELLTIHQTKALYKQLRKQFDEKNEILEEARSQLYQADTQIEMLSKQAEEIKNNEAERYLETELFEKAAALECVEEEIEVLSNLMREALKKESA